jgi:FixJ family two-component response regulator
VAKEEAIAVVDDDESVRVATSCLMRSMGYAVYTFNSAESLLSSSQLDEVSCVISDVQMPGGMSGVELQRKLAAGGRRVPVILISAFPEGALKASPLDPETTCFLSKPFDAKELVECLNKLLGKRGANTA